MRVIWVVVALLSSPLGLRVARADPAAAAPVPVAVSPVLVDFGSAAEYSRGGVGQFTVTASRPVTVLVPDRFGTGFGRVGGSCPGPPSNRVTLAAGGSCTVILQFFPTGVGVYQPALSVGWSIGLLGGDVTVGLRAESTSSPPGGTWSPDQVDFGAQTQYATSTARTATFTATRPVIIDRVYVDDPSVYRGRSPFTELSTTCTQGRQLAVGASCSAAVNLEPVTTATVTAFLALSWRPPDFPAGVGDDVVLAHLSGNGSPSGPQASIAELAYYSTTSQFEAPPIHAGDQVAFVATFAATTGDAPPEGSVSFYDGNTILTTTQLSAYLTTSYAVAFIILAAGTHTITALYTGDQTFSDNSTSPIPVTVQG